ncbi:MAG: 3,4-dihydroxy-2-butanone-4-phosphate synthase [Alphaproteobacteria bacterium]|nr:3,4-dihydroxy-2-butanone-4-phosphate synthase [Alphaproteobacteria bacterium]
MIMTFSEIISETEEIINEAKNGKMFILVDDEERENEGDLVLPAQMVTPQAINFMAKNGRGLICLALTKERVDYLKIPLMSTQNGTRHQTAFTVSIEAREGVTTGISAADRTHTIQVAIDPMKGAHDITSPGHIFPLVAREGGVLVRTGHTEAAVDIARLAGLNPSGVICEIMNDDGSMARRNDLIQFAELHGLKIGTIADLIAYRRRYDRIIERSLETTIHTRYGDEFKMFVYVNRVAYAEHIALIKGDITTSDPVLVRMHALNILDDVLGDKFNNKDHELQNAMQLLAKEKRGVLVLIREPLPTSLSDHVRSRIEKNTKLPNELRDYGIGAQILLDLGIKNMILLSNNDRTLIGLEGYGLKIVERRAIII